MTLRQEIAEAVNGAWEDGNDVDWPHDAAGAVLSLVRDRLLSDQAVRAAARKLSQSGGYRDEDGKAFVDRDAAAALAEVWESLLDAKEKTSACDRRGSCLPIRKLVYSYE